MKTTSGAGVLEAVLHSPQDPAQPLLIVTTYITKIKSQHVPAGQAHIVSQEEIVHTHTQKLSHFSNIYHQKSGGHVWEFILEMLEQEKWNITLSQAKFINVSSLTGDLSWYHVEEDVQGLGR